MDADRPLSSYTWMRSATVDGLDPHGKRVAAGFPVDETRLTRGRPDVPSIPRNKGPLIPQLYTYSKSRIKRMEETRCVLHGEGLKKSLRLYLLVRLWYRLPLLSLKTDS